MTRAHEITLSTFLEYILDHRKEEAVMGQFGQLEKFIARLASRCTNQELELDQELLTTKEWKTIFESGLWKAAHILLHQEILRIAKLDELSGDVEVTDNTNSTLSDPVIPTSAIQERAPQTVQLLREIC
ncbi:uncharacterized protein Z518_09089 [Rhinocladiella mackenziei CBS 650.93]|uniref:Uncharacterized protein n=1 Tax=Rhinocladiella mackenziei CBS 650.93 TaxID=1442369 RepID=A0A0D2I6D1_9EURO|nr:uncharacterized protein Z518_09089 [Rhinocladiella mackenziei CBS 650.93]KIX01364.1 hypothetical protein Z518_09089 [Rhinocladiella mackenziei CBS 650.93]